MRILFINNYCFLNGGAEKYLFDLASLHTSNGHAVAFFSMQHPENINTPWSSYFVSQVDLRKPHRFGTAKTLARMFFSLETIRKLHKLIKDFKPDLVHYHNVYGHLPPSLLPLLKFHRLPVIQTVHDYQLLHPNVTMFHHGKICEITKTKPELWILPHRCLDNSWFYAFPPTLAFSLAKHLKLYEDSTDLFITPSLFVRSKLIEYGFNAEKIAHLPNFIAAPPLVAPPNPTGPVLYLGRFAEAKGIDLILTAAKNLPHIPFVLMGQGPLKDRIKAVAKTTKNITLRPHSNPSIVNRLLAKCSLVVAPSLWYENQPYSVLEAFSYGKPVVASNRGGLPELVKQNRNGFVFNPEYPLYFQNAIERLWNNPKLLERLGQNAYDTIKRKHNPATHYEHLLKLYRHVRKMERV